MNQALERILLHHVEGSRAGQVDSYTQPAVVIGRAPDCHLVFSADKGVSSKHCEIRQTAGLFELVDSNSTNGTFVNDERVSSHVLKSGDSIRFGWMGPVANVEFEERVRAVHPAHPIEDAQSTVMVSARRISAAADAQAQAQAQAQAPAQSAPPVVKSPAITMPPPSRAPAPSVPPPAVSAAAAPPPRPSVPARSARPAVAGANASWSVGRWAVALTLVVLVPAAAAVGVWMVLR